MFKLCYNNHDMHSHFLTLQRLYSHDMYSHSSLCKIMSSYKCSPSSGVEILLESKCHPSGSRSSRSLFQRAFLNPPIKHLVLLQFLSKAELILSKILLHLSCTPPTIQISRICSSNLYPINFHDQENIFIFFSSFFFG